VIVLFFWLRLTKEATNEARRGVRRGKEDGVEAREISKLDELKEFYDVYVQGAEATRQKIYPFFYFLSLWKCFLHRNKMIIFNGYIKDRPIGSLMFLMHNEIIHIFAGGNSDHARSNYINVGDVLVWHAIEWAHKRNFRYFDFSGVQLFKIEGRDRKAYNIYRFKSKWGGRTVIYHDYEKLLQKNRLVSFLNHFMVDSTVHNLKGDSHIFVPYKSSFLEFGTTHSIMGKLKNSSTTLIVC